MKRFNNPSKFRRFSAAHVVLVHVLVLLTGLAPTPLMADMLSANLGAAAAATSGGPAGSAAPSSAANAIDTAAATALAHAHAQDMLTRNTLSLQAVEAMQEAARAAAAGLNNLGPNPNGPGTLPDVPNGLTPGGLQIIGTPTGADAPVQSGTPAHVIVTVHQTQQQALLNWSSFNVGKETTLAFDQSAGGADVGTWIAFNQITDPSGNPTQILGSIQAQGQVYVINQNGIIFGGTSEVNTHAMVASALPINNNLVTRGLLNNPDSQFLFSAIAQPAGNNGPTDAFTPPSIPAFGRIGNVTVQAGAHITAPTSSANVGGRVALIGPNVTNNGTISTPDGQTILAAGMQVGFDAHSADDPSLRGLDVYVGSVGTYGGTATNAGLIEAPRGSVVITGKSVNQNGFIDSSTSVALNGRIDLLANYNAVRNTNYNPSNASFGKPFVYSSGASTGVVSIGAKAVSQILPEYASTATINGTELALKSQINMQGLAVYVGTGAVVFAPNASVTVSAGVWDLLLSLGVTDQNFVKSTGQVYLDNGAIIDVSGSTGVAASISDYIFTVTLRGAELADTPLQRNSSLRGQEVTVDLRQSGIRADGTAWVGTPLANLTAYLGIIQRTVGQLTTAGGTVTISAGDSVVMQPSSQINVSGGYQNFNGGVVATTKLVVGGQLVDIARADPSVIYDGIYTGTSTSTDPRWGVVTTNTGVFTNTGTVQAAYSSGSKGGSVSITAASMALDGTLIGSTITGPLQLESAPERASLSLIFEAQQLVRNLLKNPAYSPTPPVIEFRSGSTPQAAVAAFSGTSAPLPQARRDHVFLSTNLMTPQGFGSLLVKNTDGNIVIPAGVALIAPAAGSISLSGANLEIQGTLQAPGGSLALTAYNISPYVTTTLAAQGSNGVHPAPISGRGLIHLATTAVLSTAGLIIDDRASSPTAFMVPHFVTTTNTDGSTKYVSTTQGGSIHLSSYSADLDAGSLLNVSGGLTATNSISYGAAGTLNIAAGSDPLIGSLLGGHLALGSTLAGFSGTTGGSLTIKAPTIQIGGTPVYPNTVLLNPGLFTAGGFSQFTLIGIGSNLTVPGGPDTYAPGVFIAPGAYIRPLVSTLQASFSGIGGPIYLAALLNPEGYRSTASVNFQAPGVIDFVTKVVDIRGAIVMGANTLIETDALGSVSLDGQTIEMYGQIVAPGGTVLIQGAGHYAQNSLANEALATVHLGSSAFISTAGKTVLLADVYGRRVGSVYAGGSITLGGNIITDNGARLDVSGSSSIFDLLPGEAGVPSSSGLNSVTQWVQRANSVPVQVDSNAGQISLKGGEFLLNRATLTGFAGGPKAQGGSLAVSSGRFVVPGFGSDDKDSTLVVVQNAAALPNPAFAIGQPVIGKSLGAGVTGMGYFATNTFANGGFDSLTLGGNVDFQGAVNVTARAELRVADGGVLSANDLVRLTAPYVSLGRPLLLPTRDEELLNPFTQSTGAGVVPRLITPTFGTGRLEVTANLIETGFLSLQNIGRASLTGSEALRGNGYLDIAGNLTITAGQIYPTTASTLTITAYDYVEGGIAKTGSVSILPSGVASAFPLSAGGRLSIYASTINQGGTLRAPFGTITLGWDGTGTAPKGLVTGVNAPTTQTLVLKSGSVTSVSGIDPATGLGVTIPYGIIKDGTNWIDPTGLDITNVGVPDKTIRVSGLSVSTEAGSTLDIRGGGELYGYRWVVGNGGTQDILDSSTVFAIIPGYSSRYSPFAPFASVGLNVANLGGDSGYTNSSLKVGDQIYLKASAFAAEGAYTLLPARYALLPGALLITPTSGTPVDSYVKPGGAAVTSGYRYNSLNPAVSGSIFQQFEIAPQSVINARAQYSNYLAQDFIPAAQQSLSLPVSRATLDAGYALLSAQNSMQLAGNLTASGSQYGRGGRVDVSSPLDIVIANPGAPAQANKLVLNSTLLSGWNADSVLIGGVRSDSSGSTVVNVRTNNLTVSNTAAAPLIGKDIILVANQTLTLVANSVIKQSGTESSADTLVVNGNGALVRISGVASAQTSRSGVTASTIPTLTVAAGVQLSGPSITLDSTNATSLSDSASLNGQSINLNSGSVSLIMPTNVGSAAPTGSGLVLGSSALASLQNTTALSLLSYSSIDIYGTGAFTNTGTLALHAAEIRGFNQGAAGAVTISAQSILLDNSASGTVVGAVAGTYGTLNLTSATITIGQNTLVVDQFSTVNLNASNGLVLKETGSFTAPGNITVLAPFVTAVGNANQNIVSGQTLTMTKPATTVTPPASPGLGAQVSLEGASVIANTDVLLPSGLISLRAHTGDVTIGGTLNAGGTAKVFFDQIRYTDAGDVRLTADAGNVVLSSTGIVNVSAAIAAGNAGSLTVSAPLGQFLVQSGASMLGSHGTLGTAAAFQLDVGTLASFSALNDKLNSGSFTEERSLRVRSGNVTVDGTVTSHSFYLGVDQGSITVNGVIDSSGTTGGTINLTANSSLTLAALTKTGSGSSNVLTLGDVTGITVGQAVSGTNIAAGSYITAINGNQVTLSKAVTAAVPGSTTLTFGARLTVAGTTFDSAGKGGSITLESGTVRNGFIGSSSVAGGTNANSVNPTDVVNISTGTLIDLSVASKVAGAANVVGSSAFYGQFSGTLHIRAPLINTTNNSQVVTTTANDLLVSPINGTVVDASSIQVEGYRLYSYNQATVIIQAGTGTIAGATLLTSKIQTDAVSFLGAANTTTANYTSMTNRLTANNTGLSSVLVLAPGVEIDNRGGSITLGTTTSAATNDWDLGNTTFRFGGKSAPGVLTLRASGNLEFYNTLSDGFTLSTTATIPIVERMWMSLLMTQSATLPLNTQSWAYRMAAGADFTASNFREVGTTGSVLIGKDAGQAIPFSGTGAIGDAALTRLAINPTNSTTTSGTTNATNRFQVIRTGTGSIEIFAARDVQLLNQFATIYTAGAQVASSATIFTAGDFVVPSITPNAITTPNQDGLGVEQQRYAVRYSVAGGNVVVSAKNDIIHLTSGNLDDSQRELPNNWLMRRGYVDPATGQYGTLQTIEDTLKTFTDASASTSWWINFSNFFDGVAALGGGNVTLNAGRDVKNVSAHAPTNARAASGTPSAAKMLELGGGDVTVRAGRNIDGGIYYVERGKGLLEAGNMVTTNSTRSPSLGRLAGGGVNDVLSELTWLPTTLFVGKSSFEVSARSDVLLGPAVNTMLLPQGVLNKQWYKTYFSTYAADSAVSVKSLNGNITFREEATLPQSSSPTSILSLWMNTQLLKTSGSSAYIQPWLRLLEVSTDPFVAFTTLMPGTLKSIAFSGDINLVGQITLSPSPVGTLEMLAAGAVNALRPTGVSTTAIPGSQTTIWASGSINLSDANPASIPGYLSPFSYFSVVGTSNNDAKKTISGFLQNYTAVLTESGSTTGSFDSTQAKQALHNAGLLHLNDLSPLLIYAAGSDISGLTLFAGKKSMILANRDIADIGLYIQNVRASDISVVSSGRDIIAYNANSALRSSSIAKGNLTASGELPKSGDIQINGPGTLQVLAGRNLNLGTGSNNSDGTGVGITSIGNGRNPYLPFAGANVIIGAGMGAAAVGIGGSTADFADFIAYISTTAAGTRYLTELASLLGLPAINLNDPALTAEQQKQYALAVFYLALRDAGRDHNDPSSPNAGTYAEGYAAIAKLFPTTTAGSIQTQARDIRTKSGGDISILTPGGGLQLAATTIGSTLAPPGIITESGGSINVFANSSVDIGIARIFTLKGGDIMIWSSTGDIAAGSSAKTVQSAPPTRVLIDPQSANVATDLAGLATGGGIGVLATVAGVSPGNVDLIAPIGAVDAGDAGIRATGNLNIAATIVLNSANISVGGTSAGTPAAASVSAPALGGLASAAAAGAGAASTAATQRNPNEGQAEQALAEGSPSIISVEVIGYGGGDGDDRKKSDQPGE